MVNGNMAKTNNYVNFFDLEGSYAGGGEFFKDGRYVVESGGAYFTMFDFFGKAKKGEEAPALCLELKPVDEAGKEGEAKPQFWPIRGEGVELANPIKGQKGAFASLELTGQYDTLMKGGEFFTFMEWLRKAEFSMDDYDNDITVLDGMDAVFGKTPDAYVRVDKKTGKEKTNMIVVVTEITAEKKGKGAAGKGKGKEEPAVKGKGGKSKAKDPSDMDAEEILLKYLEDIVVAEAESTTRPLLRMNIGKWITGELELDAAMAKEVAAVVNDDDKLTAAVESFGWVLKGKEIAPGKE